MKLTTDCMYCIVRSQEAKMKKLCAGEEEKSLYLKEVLKAIGESGPKVSAPLMVAEINRIRARYFGSGDMTYEEEKHRFNTLMLGLESRVEEKIRLSSDSLEAAMQYARAGNYIDFGALSEVKEETLLTLLDQAVEDPLEESAYACFQKDLETAKNLVYLTDNCGEIVMDKLLIKELKRRYPGLSVTVIVRGQPVLNDATYEDAEKTGLTDITKVIGNGTDVAGTELSLIGCEAKNAMENADLLIAKGQGNFETLKGCGLNIYYLFLCKCKMFVERFQVEQFKGALIREKQ